MYQKKDRDVQKQIKFVSIEDLVPESHILRDIDKAIDFSFIMVIIYVECPFCSSKNVGKFGKDKNGKQRYQCNNKDCSCRTFRLNYDNKGCLPEVKSKIIQMAMNGSGIRDTARVLGISQNTVISELKKRIGDTKSQHKLFK